MPWTASDIPDLTGRAAIVTGANSGIGFHTALELARHGARVTLAVRDPGRGADALARLLHEVPTADAELGRLDLADQASVRDFAAAYRGDGVDLLVNNAGIMAVPLRRTAEGWESQFATNHLGHFALTGLLLLALLAAAAPRVVVVSSSAHRVGRIEFDDLMGERRYSRWGAYAQSKLANLLFARELSRRADGTLLVAAAHPGYAATNLQRGQGSRLLEGAMAIGNRLVAQSDAQGAWPQLYAATMPDVRPDDYWGPGFFEVRGHPRRVDRAPAAQDDVVAHRLWQVSETLTGVAYDALPVRA